MSGNVLVWCRTYSGDTGVKLGSKSFNRCQPVAGENKTKKMLKRILKLNEKQAPSGEDWRFEGKNVRVTRTEVSKIE